MCSAQIFGECGGEYAGVQGHIGSPGFPFSDYPINSDCEWTVQVPINLFIEVTSIFNTLYNIFEYSFDISSAKSLNRIILPSTF